MEMCSKEELVDIEVGLDTNNFKPVSHNELDLSESDEDSDNDEDFVAADDDGDVQKYALEEGMIFADVHAFRAALKEYAIRKGFDIVRVKNEKARVTARCAAKGCPWRVHASPCDDNQVIYMVKKCGNVHRCSKVDHQKEADSTWIAEKLVPVLRKNRNVKIWDLRAKFEKYGITPAYMQLWRAKKKAVEMMRGSHKKMTSHELMKRTRALNALSLAKRSVKCSFCGSKGHNKRSCRKVKRKRPSSIVPLKQDDGMEEDIPLAEIFQVMKRERILDVKEEDDFKLVEVFEEIKKNRIINVPEEPITTEIPAIEGNNTMPLIALANQVLFQKQSNDDYFMEAGIKVYKRRGNNVQEEPVVAQIPVEEENPPHEEALAAYQDFFSQQLLKQQPYDNMQTEEALPIQDSFQLQQSDYDMPPLEPLIAYQDQSEEYMPPQETLAIQDLFQQQEQSDDNVQPQEALEIQDLLQQQQHQSDDNVQPAQRALSLQELYQQQHQQIDQELLMDPEIKVYKRRSRDWIEFFE